MELPNLKLVKPETPLIVEIQNEIPLETAERFSEKNDGYEFKDGTLMLSDRIWRYMDLNKFFDLITNKRLILTRLDLFEDLDEGSYVANEIIKYSSIPIEKNKILNTPEKYNDAVQEMRKKSFASCWYHSMSESSLMWKGYTENGKGIAIQSNVSNIIEKFRDNELKGYYGFINYNPTRFSLELNFEWNFYKNVKYKNENEFRFLVEDNNIDKDIISVSIEPNKIIEKIIFSPYYQEWEIEALKKTFKILWLNVFNINLTDDIFEKHI